MASAPRMARRIAGRCDRLKIAPHRWSKILGTSSSGGRRRSVMVLKARLLKFAGQRARFRAVRSAGVNVAQAVRMAGIPALMYGADITGMSGSHLHAARVAAHLATTPTSGGRNVDLAFFVADAAGGRFDPAFEACTGPLRAWATAWWEHWRGHEQLCNAMSAASDKLCAARRVWSAVTGPATAALASAWRLGWTFTSGRRCTTHDSTVLDFLLDSPAAVAAAADHGVRRWRLARIVAQFPELVADMDLTPDPQLEHPPRDVAGVPLLPARIVDLCTRSLGNHWRAALCGPPTAGRTCGLP